MPPLALSVSRPRLAVAARLLQRLLYIAQASFEAIQVSSIFLYLLASHIALLSTGLLSTSALLGNSHLWTYR